MKSTLYLLVICIRIFRAQTESPYFSCDPVTDCQNSSALGTQVPDPLDCEKYYVCIILPNGDIAPSASPVSCPEGYYFDHNNISCLAENVTGTCENLCANSLCRSTCPSIYVSTTVVADKYDCSSFYICRENATEHVRCPVENPYFNGHECVEDEYFCCNFCDVFCYAPYVQVIDPYDCTSFYICDANQIPVIRQTCSAATYFDEATGTCINGECTSICKICDSTFKTTEPALTETIATNPATTTATLITQVTTTTETTTNQNCIPYCPSVGVEIQDPCDCTSFYICIATGTPSEDYKLQCDPGSYFDENKQQCSIGACTPKCSTC